MIATEFVGTEYEEKISSIVQNQFEPTETSLARDVHLTLKEKSRISSISDVVLIKGTLVVSF